MTFSKNQLILSDDCISLNSATTDSWQSITSNHSHQDSSQPLSISGFYSMVYQDSPAGISLDTPATPASPRQNGMYMLSHGQRYCSDVLVLPQYATPQVNQSLNMHSEWSIPKARSNTEDSYAWPEIDFYPDWHGTITQGQAGPSIEDTKEVGAIFQPRTWICRTCNKQFQKKHALNKHIRCHSKHHVCPTFGCDYQAYLRKDLRRHIASVHGTEKIPCPIEDCEYSRTGRKGGVSRRDALKRHMENHKAIEGTL